MLAAGLDHQWAKELCVAFAAWLWEQKTDSPIAARIFLAHQPMLEGMDATYKDVTEISAEALLRDFGTATLRKHLLVRRYLEDALSLKVTAAARSNAADGDRIKVKLTEHSNQSWGCVLKEYAAWLEKQDVSIRTRRMYIAAAATFCAETKVGATGWKEDQAQRHLLRHPGAYANLFKFVRYCATVRGWDVGMPPQSDRLKRNSRPPATVMRLKRLLGKVNVEGLDVVDAVTLCRILALSFGITFAKMRAIPKEKFESDDNGLRFYAGDEWVKVPAELLSIAQTYLARITS